MNGPAHQASPNAPPDQAPKFPPTTGFHRELSGWVEAYFRSTGRRPRDRPAMYLKTALVLLWAALSYVLLVFAAGPWWQAAPLALSLGLALAAVGMNVMHDGGHQAYSDRRWVNRLMARAMDLLGCSSYVWARKHNTIHHSFTNIAGHDDDIDLGPLGRLAPGQRRRWFHRYQHYYLWPLYGLMVVKWQLVDDYWSLVTGRVAGRRFPRPRGAELGVFVGGKALFLTLAFAVPLLAGHGPWAVALGYVGVWAVTGVVLSVVFQLAHCVGEAQFPLPDAATGRMGEAWAEHQVRTTVSFARGSRVLAWLLGGLNFQVEHHLFPRVCHTHYPELSKLVEEACRLYGVPYRAHRTLWAGVKSHYRWLRAMGRPAPARPPAAVICDGST
jgi:linoleoyl-CoA desaturase